MRSPGLVVVLIMTGGFTFKNIRVSESEKIPSAFILGQLKVTEGVHIMEITTEKVQKKNQISSK